MVRLHGDVGMSKIICPALVYVACCKECACHDERGA